MLTGSEEEAEKRRMRLITWWSCRVVRISGGITLVGICGCGVPGSGTGGVQEGAVRCSDAAAVAVAALQGM